MFRTLRPEMVYVTEDVNEDPRAVACVQRLLTAMEGTRVECVSYSALNALVRRQWMGEFPHWGHQTSPRDPDIVMTTAKFLPARARRAFQKRYPDLHVRDLWGLNTAHLRRDGDMDEQWRRNCICHSAWELHSACGCPFRCAYCNFGGAIRLFVNMDEYVSHLDEICARAPAQRLYKWDNQTDVSCFEPEWGASQLLVEYFGRKEGKYLQLYVGKSDNVRYLPGLDHRGKTIIQWSISAKTQSTAIEKETAPWDRRVEAARLCQQAGYIVRFRFSPIIPVRNWEAENAALIKLIFARTQPDVISLCSFGWMDVEQARSCMNFALLDPAYVAAMESAAPFLKARGFAFGGGCPIPHDARAHLFKFLIDEIRKYSKTVPISLCLETPEMWELFRRELGLTANFDGQSSYYCNCGPMCTPEHPLSRGVQPGASLFMGEPGGKTLGPRPKTVVRGLRSKRR